MKLVEPEKVFRYLGGDSARYYELIDEIITGLTARFENFCNREFSKAERTIYYNGGRKYYYLPAYPIDLSANLEVTVLGTTYTKDSEYYVWEEDGLIEFVTAPTVSLPKSVKIIWTGGYTVRTDGVIQVPDALQRACILQTAFEFRRRNDVGITSVSMPDGSITVDSPTELLPEVRRILRQYRRYPNVY